MQIGEPDGRINRVAKRLSPHFWTARGLLAGGTTEISVADATATVGITSRVEWSMFSDGVSERPLVEWVLDRLDAGDVFWDVGGAFGAYSLLAADAGASVVTVEPSMVAIERFEANIERNDSSNEITVAQTALSDQKRTAQINSHQEIRATPEVVQFQPGDDLAEQDRIPRPEGIKIDVEGGEIEAIRGLSSVLESVSWVLVEVHSGVEPDTVRQHLGDAGLTVRDAPSPNERTETHLVGVRE